MVYSTPEDVYAIGLRPEAFVYPPRLLEGIVAASGSLLLRGHGLSVDRELTLSIQSSSIQGDPDDEFPELAEATTYYAQPAGSNVLRLAATAGGAVIAPFSNAGSGVVGILIDHRPDLLASIDAGDALLDAHFVAHQGPVNAKIAKPLSAHLGARLYVASHGLGNPAYAKSYEEPAWVARILDRLLERYATGAPLPAGSTDATPAKVENRAATVRLLGRGFLAGEREDLA